MQEVQIPDKPIAVGLTYRNTTNPSYRIYKLSSKEFAETPYNDKEKLFKTLTNNMLSKSGTIEIPQEKDMLSHSSLIALPALKPGFYILVFSNCDKFNNISDLEFIPFQVSNMTYITMKTNSVCLLSSRWTLTRACSNIKYVELSSDLMHALITTKRKR